jgi:glycerol-3-phosphate acyltransferase PlsY
LISTGSAFALIAAYLLGAIPSAVWIGKLFYGIDVREHGSGNAGATNTFRTLGKKAGIPVLLIDILKGFAAVNLVWFAGDYRPNTNDFIEMELALGVAAVVGHIFPVYVGFRGGKGISTLFGVIMAVHPAACLAAAGVFLLVFLATNYVSLGSMSAGVSLPFIIAFFFPQTAFPPMMLFSVMVAVLVVITHQKNIERLIRRQESKIRLVKKTAPSQREEAIS